MFSNYNRHDTFWQCHRGVLVKASLYKVNPLFLFLSLNPSNGEGFSILETPSGLPYPFYPFHILGPTELKANVLASHFYIKVKCGLVGLNLSIFIMDLPLI